MGDFIISNLHWDTFTGYDDFTFQLCESLFDLNLFQYVDKPTHVHGSILDVILANNFVSDIKVLDTPNYLSLDHFWFVFQFVVLLLPMLLLLNNYIFLDFASADWDQMNLYFSNCDFFNNCNFKDVEDIWSTLKHHIHTAVLFYIPRVHIKSHWRPK